MEKNMLDYIRETHNTMVENIGRWQELTEEFTRLYLDREGPITVVATGSSYNGAVCARPFMERILKVRVNVLQPFTYLHYDELPELDGFTVVVSQSGESTNAIEALQEAKKRTGTGIGITGCLDSAMARMADAAIEYGVVEESVGWVTKGVLTLDLFFKLCALRIAEKQGRLTPEETGKWLDQMRKAAECYPAAETAAMAFLERHAKLFTSMEHAYIMGAGPTYGIALEGALKLGETVRMPTFAYEMEEFLHGPNYQLSPAHTTFLVDADPGTHRRVMEIGEACACVTDRVFLISSLADDGEDGALAGHILRVPADVDPYLSSFVLLPCFQLFSYELAEQLHRWERHPLFAPFRIKCGSKTPEYLENNN